MLTPERSPYIRDLQNGLLEEGKFLVRRAVLQTAKNNKPFLRLMLADASGHMPAIYFAAQAELTKVQAIAKPGKIIRIQGIVEEFQNVKQFKLMKIEAAAEGDASVKVRASLQALLERWGHHVDVAANFASKARFYLCVAPIVFRYQPRIQSLSDEY